MSELRIQPVTQADSPYAVVFIHGVNGDGRSTWTNKRTGFFWPEALGRAIGVNTATVTYGAATNWGHSMPLQQRGISIAEQLSFDPRLSTREIVLVGHSFGGLVAKQVVRHASDDRSGRFADFMNRLAGIVFLATPHTGSALATVLEVPSRALGSKRLLQELRASSHTLLDLNRWFRERHALSGPMCIAYFETRPLRLGWFRALQPVGAAAADPGLVDTQVIPVDADHIETSKPADEYAPQFVSVAAFVKRAFEVPARYQRLPRQAAAVCFRFNGNTPEFLLVRVFPDFGWTFPKGHIEDGEPLHETARREAAEEAGVRGTLVERALTFYVQRRLTPPGREPRNEDLYVGAFLIHVDHQEGGERFRAPTWFTADEAKRRLAEGRTPFFQDEFNRVLDAAVSAISEMCQV